MDDATVIYSSNSRTENQEKLESHLKCVSNFLSANKLSVNQEKTTVTEVMLHQKRSKISGHPPSLTVKDKKGKDKIISSGKYTRILGGNIADNLTWNYHLESGKEAVLPKVRKQIGALNLIAKSIPKSSRLMLANGLIMSRISYLIQMWGAAPVTLLKKVQVIMNRAARFVTGWHKRTRTVLLMKACKWLPIEDLVQYFSLVTMWNMIQFSIPSQIHDKISYDNDRIITTVHLDY